MIALNLDTDAGLHEYQYDNGRAILIDKTELRNGAVKLK